VNGDRQRQQPDDRRRACRTKTVTVALASPEGKKAIAEATALLVSEYLFARLPLLKDALASAIVHEADYPRRPQWRRRLSRIEKAANLLVRELIDLKTAALLSDGDQQREIALSELARELHSLAWRAAEVCRRNPKTQGRGTLYPDAIAGPDPRELCALIISVLFHRVIGCWPGQRNSKVLQVCEDLWRAAEGYPHLPHRKEDGTPGKQMGWRKYLLAARKYRPPHAAGALILRMLEGPEETREKKRQPIRQRRSSYDHPASRAWLRGAAKSRR